MKRICETTFTVRIEITMEGYIHCEEGDSKNFNVDYGHRRVPSNKCAKFGANWSSNKDLYKEHTDIQTYTHTDKCKLMPVEQ